RSDGTKPPAPAVLQPSDSAFSPPVVAAVEPPAVEPVPLFCAVSLFAAAVPLLPAAVPLFAALLVALFVPAAASAQVIEPSSCLVHTPVPPLSSAHSAPSAAPSQGSTAMSAYAGEAIRRTAASAMN